MSRKRIRKLSKIEEKYVLLVRGRTFDRGQYRFSEKNSRSRGKSRSFLSNKGKNIKLMGYVRCNKERPLKRDYRVVARGKDMFCM